MANALEIGEKLMAMRAWGSSGMRTVCWIRQSMALGKWLERCWVSRGVVLTDIKGTNGEMEKYKGRGGKERA